MNAKIFREFAEKTRPLIQELNEIPGTFITGSVAIGGFKPLESDIDVVIPIQHGDTIKQLQAKFALRGFVSEPSNYNGGFKLIRQGQTIVVNVIILHPFDYCAWLFATNTLAELDFIRDRNARHRAFELAVLLFKTVDTSGRHTTLEGADMYYTAQNPECIIDVFDRLVERNTNELTF